MRIFLSYGHDQYLSLAERIKRDLKAQGHQVWFDVDRLETGGDWERYIEDGPNWASAVPDSGRFLLLMTPHSVRRPNGYCLNELSRTFSRNLPIIPVMVSTVEPPLSICRLQWLDMRQCFPSEEHETQYTKQLAHLVRALEEKQVPFEGVQQRLLNYLQPIDYSDDVSRHLPRFTGRQWVMKEVDRWLANSRRVLWITGEAGVGKSALAAWLCHECPEIAAYHYCRFGNSDRVDSRKVLFSLAYQLSTQLPSYEDRLNSSSLDKTVVEPDPLTVFDRLLVGPLSDAEPKADNPQVLLIDALDEAGKYGRNELAEIIGFEFDRLPSWLRLIVTSRPHEQEINTALQALDPWKLDAGRTENLDDIREYLHQELHPFNSREEPSEAVIEKIIEKSEGLFLYVNWIRQELEDGRLSLNRVDEFPRGLGGIYMSFFRRYFPDPKEYESISRPVLEAICAAREPLGQADLALMFNWSAYQVHSMTARLGSLFPKIDGRIRPFHQSVRDWLANPEQSGQYFVDPDAGDKRIADYVWQEYKRGPEVLTPYCVVHAPAHLSACRKAELRDLLLDVRWIELKLRASGVAALLADYALAFEPSFSSPLRPLDKGSEAVPIGIPPWRMVENIVANAKPDGTANPDTIDLRMIEGAIRLSAHVIGKDPSQFPSQIASRLLQYQDQPSIREFLSNFTRAVPRPWLHTLHPILHPPGSPLIRTLKGHAGCVHSVAITPDGRRAVSASRDKTLKVWDLISGRAQRTLEGHSREVNGVAIAPDGRRAISASWDETLIVWDLESGQILTTFTCETSASCCAFGEDHVMVAGDSAGRMYFLSLELPPEKSKERNPL